MGKGNNKKKEEKQKENEKKPFFRRYLIETIFLSIFLLIVAFNFGALFIQPDVQTSTMTPTEFKEKAQSGAVEYVEVARGSYQLKVKLLDDDTQYTTPSLLYEDFYKDINSWGVEDIRFGEQITTSKMSALSNVFSFATTLVLMYFFVKFGSYMISMMRKNTETLNETNEIQSSQNVNFDDVAGMTEEKEELRYAIESLRSNTRLSERGMRPIRGILFEGPPGVGKTMLAKAFANEAGVNFMSYSGAGFTQMYVGLGAMRVRNMYAKAKANAPCVVFIDEMDAVGSTRAVSPSGGSRETNNTLNALLEVMDGVGSEDGVLFIGATNLADNLDSALVRPGRFDRIIKVGLPRSKEDREAIVAVHLKNKTLKEGVTVSAVAKLCFGMSGAEIAGVLNDAVMESFRDNEDGIIDIKHVDSAMMRMVVKGLAKGKHSGETLFRVAVHEAGHAVMNQVVGKSVVKVAVQPYSSGVGGVTITDNSEQEAFNLMTKEDYVSRLKVLYGGMAAEEVILGSFSNGNTNDLEVATNLLHNMIGAHGMGGESILSISYLGKVDPSSRLSKELLARMDELGQEVLRGVKEYFMHPVIRDHIVAIANSLVEKETIYELPDLPDLSGNKDVEQMELPFELLGKSSIHFAD